MSDEIAYCDSDDGKSYRMSVEELSKYYDFVGYDRNNIPMFRVKPQYRQSKSKGAIETGASIIFKLFGL